MSKYSHLSNEDRFCIETGLMNRLSFREIGEKTGKNSTTISKEIRSHRSSNLYYEVTGVKGQILKTSHSHKQSHLCFSDSIRKEH